MELFKPENIVVAQSADETILPVYFPPPIKCHLPYSIISSIVVANMESWDWMNNNFIQILKRSKRRQRIQFYPSQNFAYWDQSVLTAVELKTNVMPLGADQVVDFLIYTIDHGYYAVLYLDEYYIPQTRLYHQDHIIHSQFIYGYNKNGKRFKLLNFDQVTNNLNLIDFRFEDLVSVYKISTGAFLDLGVATKKDTDYRLILLKSLLGKENRLQAEFQMDADAINAQLFDFLNSINSSKRTTYFTGTIQGTWGISIYNNLAENFLSLGEDEIDIRGLYLIYEHKVFMMKRFQDLYRLGLADNYEDTLREIVSTAEKMKMLAYKYNFSRNGKVLEKIVELLNRLEKMEKETYTKHLEKYWLKNSF